MERSRIPTGRLLVVALLVGVAVVHAVLAVRLWDTEVVAAGVDVLIALAALVVAPLVVLRPDPAPALLAAAVVGAVGVALYLLPGLVVTLHRGHYTDWLDPWAFAGLLVDALVVRIAVVTLRRAESSRPDRHR